MTGSHLGNLLSTFLISIAPVVELRGGIPWGVAHDLPLWEAYCAAVLGNMLPVPFVILFMRHVLNWLRSIPKIGALADRLEARALAKGEKVQKYEALGLFLLVAVPLPGTGAWTGALVASVFDMRLKRAFPIILLGVMAAGILMLLLSHGVINLI
ncbi:MAG: small multi-drug export protein [Clostridiales bacterium]|nr:small multi-drug export protein [Clostridiales bacterium]